MSKHTPGPWTFYADVPSTEPNWHIVTNASRMRVLANVHITPGNEMDLANAHLIASAPDLLESLEATNLLLRTQRHACESTEVCHMLDSHIKRNNAAIAKARGEA